MNNNPHNFCLFDEAILDKGFNNECIVSIRDFSPNKLIATVCCKGETIMDSWEVLTKRLTPIKNEK